MRVAPLAVVGITRYHRPATKFTIIRNSFLRNATVGLAAFRVGAYILTHEDGFVQTQVEIARAVGLSVTTVRKALRELAAAGHVASREIRERGRVMGTAYAVSDVPFTQDELANLCPPCAESVCRESVRTASTPPKKTTPFRETTQDEKTSPSGGSPADAGSGATDVGHRGNSEEEPVKLDLSDAPALFEMPPAPKPPRTPDASTVTAAYVDSHRTSHGRDPLRRDVGRVARDAAALLRAGEATVEELTAAASKLGQGCYSNLPVEVKKSRGTGARTTKGMAPAVPHGDDAWEKGAAEVAAHAEWLVANDPEMAAFMAGRGAA